MKKKLQRIWNVLSHPRLLRMALSGFGAALCEENHLGALSDKERTALSLWVRSSGAGAQPLGAICAGIVVLPLVATAIGLLAWLCPSLGDFLFN